MGSEGHTFLPPSLSGAKVSSCSSIFSSLGNPSNALMRTYFLATTMAIVNQHVVNLSAISSDTEAQQTSEKSERCAVGRFSLSTFIMLITCCSQDKINSLFRHLWVFIWGKHKYICLSFAIQNLNSRWNPPRPRQGPAFLTAYSTKSQPWPLRS